MPQEESARAEPVWLDEQVALAIHDRQLAEHGGGSGIRDEGALQSALTRPLNKWNYGEQNLCALAAACAFGIARNHPFTDGNKRTAWVLARSLLVLNGVRIAFGPEDAIRMVVALAAGDLTEDDVAAWFRAQVR